MTFYDRLVAEVANEREIFLALPIIQAGIQGELSKETYIGYLSEAFHHVKHTVPLAEIVRSQLSSDHKALQDGLSDFILAKKGNEKWILQDIKHAGGDVDKVLAAEPATATEELLAYAYDYVRRISPIGFFGMIFVIEGTGSALATQTVDKLMRSLDLPPRCFSYLLSHGSLDLADMDFFKVLVAQITDRTEQDAIISMSKQMFGLYGKVFESIALKSGFGGTAT
ncbi:MAG: iron-containing redox enzyme family protein [Kordiimonadaceae bacterium]|nr:iron-containing redox enzyme family protein [Kordiimonadaceae bacterium]